MKILLTGATAAQVSATKNKDVLTFAGLVNRALIDGGHDVTWIEPSVNMSKDYLDEFDSVVVGLAPPTSTGAHRIYGALSVAQYASELGSLRIMIDAPEPRKLWYGLRTIYNKPEELTKDFYAKRREYSSVLNEDVLDRLHSAVTGLYERPWAKTIYPKFPWMSFPSVSSYIPQTSSSNLVGLSLDSWVLENREFQTESVESDYWAVDVYNSSWTKAMEQTISGRTVPTHATKWQSDEIALETIRKSIGCLVSTYYRGDPWWSPALAQAISVSTPVVTDWRLSSYLGAPWSLLASNVEEMTPSQRYALSYQQYDTYVANTLSWKSAVELTCYTILN
jgi:hypothetical protein